MSSRTRLVGALGVVAAAVFVYRSVVSAYFFDDDFQWLVGSWSFTARQLVAIADANHFYRPIIDLYFAVATPLFGGSPTLFHVANILLHAANGLIVLALVRACSGNDIYASLTALFFVIQPADVDTVAWVSALAEAIGAFLGCLALLWFLRYRREGRHVWHVLSVVVFVLALLSHVSSVVFLVLMILVDWAFVPRQIDAHTRSWTRLIRGYSPYALVLAAYLTLDLWINSRHYVVTGGQYRLGSHILTNVRDYIVALYVGKGNVANYVLIAAGVLLLLLKGNRRVKFAIAWILVTLLPFVSFTWGITTRYLYLPAVGFSMLLAEGLVQLDRLLATRAPRAARIAAVSLVATVMAVRFVVFASANVRSFAARTEEYRRYITHFKETHGALPSGSRVAADDADPKLPRRFVEALIQWEYRDPTIQLIRDQSALRPA